MAVSAPNSLLLVDDEPQVCNALKRALRRQGYTIHTAHSASEAMSILENHSVDVILSDQRMPGKQGTELLGDAMRNYPATIRMILSGAAEISDITQAMEAGAIYKFLTKPIDAALLRANISEAFARSRSLASVSSLSFDTDEEISPSDGMLTRSQLERVYPQVSHEAREGGRTMCLVLVYTHQYESIVGSFGFAMGQQFKSLVAERLATEFAAPHLVCIPSPGIYAILTADCNPPARLANVRARVEQVLLEPVVVAGHRLCVTASFGATISHTEDPIEKLMDQAHAAAITASRCGSESMQIYVAGLVNNFRNQLQLESDLRAAIANGSFELFYQPQVDIVSGEIVGLEALLRWPHDDHGFVSPAEFIPIAERIGCIDQIGAWAMKNALMQYSRWQSVDCAPAEVAVNVSPLQLRNRKFAESVAQELRKAKVDPKCLVIEITESAAMDCSDVIVSSLYELNQLGVTLAIDDFGSGYASMRCLTRFAFKKLKIDRSLVPQPNDVRSKTVFQSVVAMAQALGVTVVAEGIETPSELAAVFDSGARVVQGYFYSPPVSAERMDQLLSARLVEPRAALTGLDTLPGVAIN